MHTNCKQAIPVTKQLLKFSDAEIWLAIFTA